MKLNILNTEKKAKLNRTKIDKGSKAIYNTVATHR